MRQISAFGKLTYTRMISNLIYLKLMEGGWTTQHLTSFSNHKSHLNQENKSTDQWVTFIFSYFSLKKQAEPLIGFELTSDRRRPMKCQDTLTSHGPSSKFNS